MKKLTSVLMMIGILIVYGIMSSYRNYEVRIKAENRDTVITLNDTLSLYYASYHPQMKLWYNLHIKTSKKLIKIISGNEYKGTGSELFYSLSPNAHYVVVDAIVKDYVYTNDHDSTLYENYACAIIDLKSAAVIKQLQQDCDGSWNKRNQWVSPTGKVVFE